METSPSDKIKKYLEVDYPEASNFYDRRAVIAKRWYRFLSVYLISVSAVLTVATGLSLSGVFWKFAIPIASASIGVAAALLSHYKCHENWLSYRATWDALERERRFFETGTEKYADVNNSGAVFVSQIEAIRSREGDDFYARHRKTDEQANLPIQDAVPEKLRKPHK
jgi:hypothetical protein